MKPQIITSKDNPKLLSATCTLEWYEHLAKQYAESGKAMQASMWTAKAKNMRTAEIKDTDYVYDETLMREINGGSDGENNGA